MFKKILVANRGEIACRIIRTLDRMGIAAIGVYSEADRDARHVMQAAEAICLGASPASESYLDVEKILAAARATGAEAIHPGYGFLAENPAFAEACAGAGVAFIGPRPEQIRRFGLKHEARALALGADVKLAPGSSLLRDADEARYQAARIGYPIMLKSSAGGGGIGLQLCRSESEIDGAFARVARLATAHFGGGGVFLERYIEHGRHVEVQIFGDGKGRVVALGERDCSTQRRNQKIIEETPAPGLTDALRAQLAASAIRLGQAVEYASAGTVEFIYDTRHDDFYFLEVNTRLQVEHGVTEAVTGIDLVEWMIRLAAGEDLPLDVPVPRGAAIEVRLYAEDPSRGFLPSTGLVTEARFAEDARIETWIEAGTEITPFYDPLLAKIIVSGADRTEALAKLGTALAATSIAGIETNLGYLRHLVGAPLFADGVMTTRALESFAYAPRTIEVLEPGTQTTVQDYPGRMGYWHVGVPPSGPMDALSFRLANRALGNPPAAPALELTLVGPALKFNSAAEICLAGAEMAAELDGRKVPFRCPVAVPAGGILRLGAVVDAGCRTYLAIRGGLDLPAYLGSRATFTLGKFGGHGGRALHAGDILHLGSADAGVTQPIPAPVAPMIGHDWVLGVLDGPHGAPDFFTPADIEAFFAATWDVHYNSNRTGIRLIGPKPEWARDDGGEAGLHPSNIHDNAYAIGTVDFTGDMPVILGPDGPSLGGFVCPATLAAAELWKLGQLRPGDRVRFHKLTADEAEAAEAAQEQLIATLSPPPQPPRPPPSMRIDAAILQSLPETPLHPKVVYRRAGDKYLLIEYGPPVLDFSLRLRVHALMLWLERQSLAGIIDLTPGIRSLQIHYDGHRLTLDDLLRHLTAAEATLPLAHNITVPSRIVHLPLSWDDEATRLAIARYMQSVRNDAPWCPSNIEFIRRINGLETIDQVKEIVFAARYLVLGLGDVYLGAPVATPIDPRHRLVTTKYNPARIWTPENAVGIGGAYLCVYGMEGPGGYQFVGRTVQMWNPHRVTAAFEAGRPWLLRFFDQIRFYPVSNAELQQFRADFLSGRARLQVETAEFSLHEHRAFLDDNAASIEAARRRQRAAFDAERARWAESDRSSASAALPDPPIAPADEIPPGCRPILSPVSGSVWRVLAKPGDRVERGTPVIVVESMKMEMPVAAPAAGILAELRCAEGRPVSAGQVLAIFEADADGA
jgi:urea carboxylase